MANPFGRLMSLARKVATGKAKAHFVALDVQRKSLASMTSATQHEQRTAGDLSHIDESRTHLNKRVAYDGIEDSPKKAAEAYIKDKGIQFDKRNHTPITSLVLSASPEYFEMKDGIPNEKKTAQWAKATMGWAVETFGEDLVHCSLHLDEKTPHFHLHVVPTYEKKTKHRTVIQGSHSKCKAFGGRGSYHRLWDGYAAATAHLGLHRGERVPEGARGSHRTARQWVNDMARRWGGRAQEMALLDEREAKVSAREERATQREDSLNAEAKELVAYRKTLEDCEGMLVKAAESIDDVWMKSQALDKVKPVQRALRADETTKTVQRVEKRARRSTKRKGKAPAER